MVYNKRKRMFCGALRRGGYHAQHRCYFGRSFLRRRERSAALPLRERLSRPARRFLQFLSPSRREDGALRYRRSCRLRTVPRKRGARFGRQEARLYRRPSHGARPFFDSLRSAPAPSRSHRCLQSEDRRDAQKLRLLRGRKAARQRRRRALDGWCIGRKS